MGSFWSALGTEAMIPAIAVGLTAAWKLLAKPKLVVAPEDWSLAFDLLLATAVLQVAFIGGTVDQWVSGDSGVSGQVYANRLAAQLLLFVVVAVVLPLLTALWLRSAYRTTGELTYQREGTSAAVYDVLQELELRVAVQTSVAAGFVLMGTFVLNYFLPSLVH